MSRQSCGFRMSQRAVIGPGLLLIVGLCASPASAELKVFILAGQSNMEGHGNVRMSARVREDLEKNGTFDRDRHNYLDYLARESQKKSRYRHLLDEDGEWASRDDVWFYWKRTGHSGGPVKSKLTVGLGAGESRDRIGPELQLGHVLGDYFDEPVLLIKTAWGGKSLAVDFRPPGAGLPPEEVLRARLEEINAASEKRGSPRITMDELKESYGRFYRLMIEEVDWVLENLKAEFPDYDASEGHAIAGFVWFQGWNDGGSLDHASEYAANFKHLVADLRKKYGDLPVVIGTSGFGKNAPSSSDGWVNRLKEHVEPAQIAAAGELEDTEYFATGDCLIPHPDRKSNRGIHHWFNSAETYCLIGEGLGRTMRGLLERRKGEPGKRASGAGKAAPDHSDVRYGPHERNVLDLWLARSAKPTPLVIYYHGGGFRAGDKRSLNPELLARLREGGISVAAANYRLSATAPYPAQMHDCARALQFLRHHAKKYNIDPGRIGATGGSAGAGISMWLGFHDDLADPTSSDPVERESTRVQAAVVYGAQSSYDPRVIGKLFDTEQIHPALFPFFGLKDAGEVDDPRFHPLFEDASPITHASAGDSPVFLFYPQANRPLPANSSGAQHIHHPKLGFLLKKRLDELGVECVLKLREDYPAGTRAPVDDYVRFFFKHLRA